MPGKTFICSCAMAVFFCFSLFAVVPPDVDNGKRENIIRLLELQGMMGYAPDIKGSDPLLKNLQKEQMDKTRELMILAYDKYLSDDEVLELIGFFDSPAWKKYKKVAPLITQDLMAASKALTEKTSGIIKDEENTPISKMKADPNSAMGKELIKLKEMRTSAALLRIRSALSFYYSKSEGEYPRTLDPGLKDQISPIPIELITGSNNVGGKFDGTGGWFYNPSTGVVGLNAPGKDLTGKDYSSY